MLGKKVQEKVVPSKLVTTWAAEAWGVRSGLKDWKSGGGLTCVT